MSEIDDKFAIAHDLLTYLKSRFEAGELEKRKVDGTLSEIIYALVSFDHPATVGNKARVGFDLDEALIMASLSDFGGSIEKAAREHWQGDREDIVDAKIRKLYRHKKALEDIGETF